MSNKQDKRMRRLARRQARAEYSSIIAAIAERNERLLKPKPRWIPMGLYVWMLGFFVNIKKEV